MTYSRPSDVNPPKPFQNRSSSGGVAFGVVVSVEVDVVALNSGGRAAAAGRRSICSAREPRFAPRTALAAAVMSTVSSAGTLPALRTNIPPAFQASRHADRPREWL